MFSKWICFLLFAGMPLSAKAAPSVDQIISRVVARDKELVQRRKAFDYDVEITREQLDSNRAVTSTAREKMVVTGDRQPGYGTRSAAGNPEQEVQKTSREEPF